MNGTMKAALQEMINVNVFNLLVTCMNISPFVQYTPKRDNHQDFLTRPLKKTPVQPTPFG